MEIHMSKTTQSRHVPKFKAGEEFEWQGATYEVLEVVDEGYLCDFAFAPRSLEPYTFVWNDEPEMERV
jgi:hypothetical protein